MQHVVVREIDDAKVLSPTDVVVQVSMAGLCGSDLHPFFGRETGLDRGTVMGHEFVGTVHETGTAVQDFRVGDRVCAPFTTNCGQCFYCQRGLTSRCVSGQLFGWRKDGQGLHGCQAEYVRVPLADGTLMKVPEGMSDETAILLGDNLSTGYFCADMVGVEAGGVYVVVGCGNVGLLAIASARRMGAETVVAIDPVPARLEIAEQLGAVAFADTSSALRYVFDKTNGRGADGVMELVGLPEAQQTAYQMIRPGGVMSVIGCHCTPGFAFSPVDAYDKNLTYRTGRCPARHYMEKVAKEIAETPIDLSWCISHQFGVRDGVRAYDTFAGRKDNCIKAVLIFG